MLRELSSFLFNSLRFYFKINVPVLKMFLHILELKIGQCLLAEVSFPIGPLCRVLLRMTDTVAQKDFERLRDRISCIVISNRSVARICDGRYVPVASGENFMDGR